MESVKAEGKKAHRQSILYSFDIVPQASDYQLMVFKIFLLWLSKALLISGKLFTNMIFLIGNPL